MVQTLALEWKEVTLPTNIKDQYFQLLPYKLILVAEWVAVV